MYEKQTCLHNRKFISFRRLLALSNSSFKKSIRAVIMAKEIDVQQAELESFQLYALLKAAAFSSDELEPSETKALFELAYSLSVPVSCFMQSLEQEICNDGK